MDKKLLSEAAFDSFWNWFVGGIMTAISIVGLFFPNLQPLMNYPTLSSILSPTGWLATGILGLIIWLIGFAWNVRKRLKEKLDKRLQKQDSLSLHSKSKNGNSVAIGGDNYAPIYQGHRDEDKIETPPNRPALNWEMVEIMPWNKRLSENEVRGGVFIENNTREKIEKCYVEIIEIYDQTGLGLYNPLQRELPRTAAWELDGEIFYKKIEIGIGKQKRLALIYETWLMSGASIFFIGGKNGFKHHFGNNETYFVEIEISDIIGKQKAKFIEIFFDGKKFTVKNVLSDLPKVSI